ncbi:MAG: hypothetical protein ACXAEN_25135 [Candidatus Thorarchaeota archaeon]|jgi:hypothetical protein
MSRLLYQEPRSSYFGDKLEDSFIIIMILIAVFVVAYIPLDPSRLEGLSRNVGYILFMAVVIMSIVMVLHSSVSSAFSRRRLEIFTDEIRLPFPKKGLKASGKLGGNVLKIRSIETANLEFTTVKTPFKSLSSKPVWKCTFELKDGERIVISQSTKAFGKFRALEALKEFIRGIEE